MLLLVDGDANGSDAGLASPARFLTRFQRAEPAPCDLLVMGVRGQQILRTSSAHDVKVDWASIWNACEATAGGVETFRLWVDLRLRVICFWFGRDFTEPVSRS